MRDKLSADEIESISVIDFEYFKKALVRIAALAQDKLSGTAASKAPDVRM
jgi:hypothetical protein